MCSSASAIVGETPARPFSSLESVTRFTRSRPAHSATVQAFGLHALPDNLTGMHRVEHGHGSALHRRVRDGDLVVGSAGEEADRLDDFRGLNERNPWFAFMMLVRLRYLAR